MRCATLVVPLGGFYSPFPASFAYPPHAGTDWAQIAALYDILLSRWATPVVELNAAVAVAMAAGPAAGLARVDAIAGREELEGYHLFHATRADLLRRLGRAREAVDAYVRALEIATNDAERRWLRARIDLVRSEIGAS